ncbi:MAG: hypothetical protein WB676_12405 [Bryobacteraceae bacterium]
MRFLRFCHSTLRILYVFVALEIGSRRLVHFNVTEHPTAEWTLQQLLGALPYDQDCKFLRHDRHKTFSASLDDAVKSWGIHVLKSPRSHADRQRTLRTVDWNDTPGMSGLSHPPQRVSFATNPS